MDALYQRHVALYELMFRCHGCRCHCWFGESRNDRVGSSLVAPDNDEAGIAFGMSSECFYDVLPNSRCPTDKDGNWDGEKAALYGMNLSAVIPIISNKYQKRANSLPGPDYFDEEAKCYGRLFEFCRVTFCHSRQWDRMTLAKF